MQIKRFQYKEVWPIDKEAIKQPEGWQGWPDQKKFALILTHDVDTVKGQQKCQNLAEIEKSLGFRSSFNFVPERYIVSSELRQNLIEYGFEVGVHGLNHDGKLYQSKDTFLNRAVLINKYLETWESVGFRSPAMHHNLDWIHYLKIQYDSSTFDTDPFEPQPDGMKTIFPFWVKSPTFTKGYVELPYTLPQDFTLFILMQEKTIDVWKRKLDWIAKKNGMALLNVHPDYMYFSKANSNKMEYPASYYNEFLLYVKTKYNNQYWNVLPRELAYFFKDNYVYH